MIHSFESGRFCRYGQEKVVRDAVWTRTYVFSIQQILTCIRALRNTRFSNSVQLPSYCTGSKYPGWLNAIQRWRTLGATSSRWHSAAVWGGLEGVWRGNTCTFFIHSGSIGYEGILLAGGTFDTPSPPPWHVRVSADVYRIEHHMPILSSSSCLQRIWTFGYLVPHQLKMTWLPAM